jgi:glycosyltransferase involved in cell wall biosynthesis
MRILAVAESFFGDHRNGLARVAWDVARAMALRGHDVQLLCPASGPIAAETTLIEGVAVTRYPRPRPSAFNPGNPSVHIAGYTAAIHEALKHRQCDVVHCHGIYAMNAAAEVVGGSMPKVLTIHSPALLEQAWAWTHGPASDWVKLVGLPLIRHFEQRAIAASTVCHSLSRYTRDTVQSVYHGAAEKAWRVIPHWVDAAWSRTVSKTLARQQLGWPAETRIVLTVRQLKPRYGIDFAIRALAPLLKKGGVEFRIVGDGPQRQALESLAAAAGVWESVLFEGAIPDEMLRLAYQGADAFVIPSRALECFGLIAQEAMAVGLPTVATMVGALPEILGPVAPEMLVPPGDQALLRERVACILAAAETAAAIQAAAMLASATQHRYAESRIVPMYDRLFRDPFISN